MTNCINSYIKRKNRNESFFQTYIIKILYSLYANYIEFQSKLKISSQTSPTLVNKLAQLNINKIGPSFLLDIRREENNLRENTLKAIWKEAMMNAEKINKSNVNARKDIDKTKEQIK